MNFLLGCHLNLKFENTLVVVVLSTSGFISKTSFRRISVGYSAVVRCGEVCLIEGKKLPFDGLF